MYGHSEIGFVVCQITNIRLIVSTKNMVITISWDNRPFMYLQFTICIECECSVPIRQANWIVGENDAKKV